MPFSGKMPSRTGSADLFLPRHCWFAFPANCLFYERFFITLRFGFLLFALVRLRRGERFACIPFGRSEFLGRSGLLRFDAGVVHALHGDLGAVLRNLSDFALLVDVEVGDLIVYCVVVI